MTAVYDSRDKMIKLFEEFEATELRLKNVCGADKYDSDLVESVQKQYDLSAEQFNAAWDAWNDAMSKERLAVMNRVQK